MDKRIESSRLETLASNWLQRLRIFDMACLLPAGCAALISPMAFDSGSGLFNWTLFLLFAGAPIVVLVAILGSGHLRNQNRQVAALAVAALPLYFAVAFALLAMAEALWRLAA